MQDLPENPNESNENNEIKNFNAPILKYPNFIDLKKKVYDLEINVNSILGFLKGWDIKYSEEGKKRNDFAKRNPTKIFSVIGNKNRGKSFILSKIAKRDLPCGYSVTTRGLSISFPEFDNIALLDSVGFESPLLENDGEDYRLKSDNNDDNKIYEILHKLEIDIQKSRNKPNPNINDIRDKENEYFRERNKFRKKIKNKDEQIYSLTNERRITDFFLQRFIIENANVVLLVVEKLSIDDQFFLNKLTKLIKEHNDKFLQKIIVVHNLMKMKEKKIVEDYIKNTLKKSLTFTLKEKHDMRLKSEKANKPYNKTRYFEESEDPSEKEIIHLIMAQEDTEAGDFYNEAAIEYIRQTGKIITNTKEFDVIEKLKTFFCKVSDSILTFDDINEKINPKNIKLIQNKDKNKDKNKNVQKLKLEYNKGINIETFYGDIINDTFGEPKFTPLYHIDSSDQDYLKIFLDCPGICIIKDVDVSYPNQQTKVVIKGKREKQNIKTMGRKFGSGEFELKITLKGKNGYIKKIGEIKDPIDGFYEIRFERIKDETNF